MNEYVLFDKTRGLYLQDDDNMSTTPNLQNAMIVVGKNLVKDFISKHSNYTSKIVHRPNEEKVHYIELC